MGRGIDFKGVNMVVNYDFPPTAVSYIHRIGKCLLLVNEDLKTKLYTVK